MSRGPLGRGIGSGTVKTGESTRETTGYDKGCRIINSNSKLVCGGGAMLLAVMTFCVSLSEGVLSLREAAGALTHVVTAFPSRRSQSMEEGECLILGQRFETFDGPVGSLDQPPQGIILPPKRLEFRLVLRGPGVLAGGVGALGVASLAGGTRWLLVVTLRCWTSQSVDKSLPGGQEVI